LASARTQSVTTLTIWQQLLNGQPFFCIIEINHSRQANIILNKNLVLVLAISLSIIIAWQSKILFEQTDSGRIDLSDLDAQIKSTEMDSSNYTQTKIPINSAGSESWADAIALKLESHLADKQWQEAVDSIDEAYSLASTEDLSRFRAIVFRHIGLLRSDTNWQSAISLLQQYSAAFDDLDAWRQLGFVAAEHGDWDTAITALLASSSQENDPEAYAASLRALVRASSLARASLERRGDQLGVLKLYQRLYEQHPSHLRFQFELAQAYLHTNNPQPAIPYLQALLYDPEFGALAQQLLDAIDASQPSQSPNIANLEPAKHHASNTQNILVPLIRSGGSMLVDASINSSPMRFLLDTGASITALSQQSIQRLGLEPLNRSIRLNTANGVVSSPLYTARQLNLGSIQIDNLVLAQVDLGQNTRVDGLLGTDVLNASKDRFNYVIDDQKMALIFRKK
jgi:clan AA aspartic protease (TIGR02281 family)